MTRSRVVVLVSGGGTNLQSLLDAERAGSLGAATVVGVVSNRPGVRALERAAAAGVPTRVLDHRAFADRSAFDAALRAEVEALRADVVVLAGFMRVLTEAFLAGFVDRVINIHPSLLPAFPGVRGPAQALQYGVKISGCTVHFVDAGLDTGAVIAQAAVPVRDDDTEETLAARILAEEHRLLPAAVADLAGGRLRREGRRVHRVP
ncbi:MAG: phosphoribosylglycinamide formyltransferase [Deltaproteobacteria bacterium]|nr:phosphoribosylglycinamide formyltransferase [Myxococcales bacterium]MDP3218574.1 phosphoribosylglycinamide formyltransferase [Deltaproteobacteria bacterium]